MLARPGPTANGCVGSARTLESTLERFRQAAGDHDIPLTFVAHINDQPIGMASLFDDDCDRRKSDVVDDGLPGR